MRRFWLTFIFLLATQVLASEPVAFVNVNVVPMSADTVLRQRTVVVHDGVIQAIGGVDGVPIPKDAKVIDGTDRFLVPGLAEMHAHVPATDSPELDRYFTLYVANGVTLIEARLQNLERVFRELTGGDDEDAGKPPRRRRRKPVEEEE